MGGLSGHHADPCLPGAQNHVAPYEEGDHPEGEAEVMQLESMRLLAPEQAQSREHVVDTCVILSVLLHPISSMASAQ